MSDRTLQAQITAVDKASPVFAQVANGAQKMGTSIQQSAEKTNQSLRGNKAAMDDLKVGAVALTAAFGLASRAALDQSRQIDAINRLYGESADAILDLSEAIQDNTNFSNDAARQAAITGSTLAENYGLTADQIGVLIERSADLAQVHGIDLANAMERVSGAIRGEGEAAELLGLNMSDSAVATAAAAAGITNWNTTMTEAEKAAFRYSLVLEQTTATQGAAADAADTTAGKIAQLSNKVQDAAQSFAAWTGPIGEATAALSEHAIEIAVVGGGITKLAAGLGVTAAGFASVAAVVAPLAAVGGVFASTFVDLMKRENEQADAAREAAVASRELAVVIHDLVASGSPQSATATAWANALTEGLKGVPEQIKAIRDEMTALAGTDQPQAIDPNATDEASLKMAQLERQLEELAHASDDAAAAQVALGAIFQDTGTGADLARKAAADLFDQFARDHDIVKLAQGLIDINKNLGFFDQQANAAAEAARQLAIATTGAADGFDVLDDAVAELGTTFEETTKGQKLLTDLQLIATKGTEEQRAAIQKAWEEADESKQKFDLFTSAVSISASAIRNDAKAADELAAAFVRATDRQAAFQEGWSNSIAVAQADTMEDFAQATDRQAYAQEQQSGIMAEFAAIQEDAAGAAAGFGDALAGVGAETDSATEKIKAGNAAWHAQASAMEELAHGSTAAGDALRAFKDIQDGIISQQDVFNQQFSEYGSQISAIERAQEILNTRREEGVKLSQDELDFLDEAPKALERLEGGQEDAAIAAGELATQYGENMTAGDRLNQTLGGLDSTLQGVSDSVSTLVAVLVELNNTDAEPSVTLSGAGDALADALAVQSALLAVEGVYNATVNVGANIDPRLSGALPFRDGGIVPYEEARVGTVTRGMRAVRVGEAGPETVLLPGGSYVRNAAATAASGGGGVIVNMHIGTVSGMGGFEDALTEMTRMVRARFAGLGM